MEFEIYCDESGLEALTRKDAHKFIAIGGVWMPSDFRVQFKEDVNTIKSKYNVYGELKWKKISPKFLDLYKDLLDYFFQTDQLRFRVIEIEAKTVDNIKYNNDDAELGFYKFYYQLLHHWLFDFNTYSIFLDLKENRNKGRLKELNKVLNNSNLFTNIVQVQGLPSDQSLGIQLADVLTGLCNAKYNNITTSTAKNCLIKHVEDNYLKKAIASTHREEDKFNVFKINLQGGW